MTNHHKNYRKDLPKEIKALIWICHCCENENISGVKVLCGVERCPICYSVREEKKVKNDKVP